MMEEISYNIPFVAQNVKDCVQSSASQILSYYGIKKSIEEIKKEVPVYISSNGNPLGSSMGHIATYFIQLGFSTTIHTVDIELFDLSWKNLDSKVLVQKLKERRKYFKHARYEDAALDLVVDGYVQFLENGGKLIFPIVDELYFYEQLKSGPVYAVVSYEFFNQIAKHAFVSNKKLIQDAVVGSPSTHAVVISGYKDGKFEIIDPDYTFGGKRFITSSLLVGAFYLAETDFDPLLITLKK